MEDEAHSRATTKKTMVGIGAFISPLTTIDSRKVTRMALSISSLS